MTTCCTRLFLAFVVTSLFWASTASAGPILTEMPQTPAQTRPNPDAPAIRHAIDQVAPALVRILSVNAIYDQGREIKRTASGSGVIITPEGHVVTNHHVVGTARQISCTLADRTEVDADLIGADPLTDIAVMKLRPKEARQFPVARFGDSSALAVGDPVLAMGSPLALSQSVTLGIVSNTALTMPRAFWPFNRLRIEGEDVGSSVRWIGHDASIFPGNSGGPLVNLRGEIIGINEIVMGIGGAIPGNQAREIAERLIGRELIDRAWLGLEFQPLLKNSATQQGVLVSSVIAGSPGEKAGLRSGDTLLAIGGSQVKVQFPEELPLLAQRIERLPLDRPTPLTIQRETGTFTVEVTPRRREYRQPRPREFRKWGITGRDLSALGAKEMRRPDKNGVLVTSLKPGGPAATANPRLMPNDVIVLVEGKPVANARGLAALTTELLKDRTEPLNVLVTFDRNRERMLTVVRIGTRDLDDPGMEVRKAWLPVTVQGVTREITEKLKLPAKSGMIITQVYPNTNAARLGLRPGDVILKVDAEPVPMASPGETESFQAMIRQYRIGTPVDLTLWRDGTEFKVSVPLAESPRATRELKRYNDELFDFTVRDIAFLDRADESWDAQQTGVLVETVGEGGWASLAYLAVGDLIVAVDGTEISTVKEFESLMKEKAGQRPRSIVLKVWRGIYSLFVELQPAWNSNP